MPDANDIKTAPAKARGRRLPFVPTDAQRAKIERIARIEAADCNNGNVIRARGAFERLMLGVAGTCDRELPDGTFVSPPDGVEGWAMVLTGPSAVGKSNVLKTIVRDPRLAYRVEDGVPWMPILALTAPSPSTIKTLGAKMLEKMGAEPPGPRVEEHFVMHRVRQMMIALGVVVVMVDEFHHALVDRNRGDLKRLAETMKNMMKGEPLLVPDKLADRDRRVVNDRTVRHPVHLILAGTPDLRDFAKNRETHSNDQFANKARVTSFLEIPLERSADGPAVYKGLAEFIRALVVEMGFPAGDADPLVTGDMLARFHKGSARHFGRCADLLKRAGILAVAAGGTATLSSKLADAFEELYATGTDKNCFKVADIEKCPAPPQPVKKATKDDFGSAKETAR